MNRAYLGLALGTAIVLCAVGGFLAGRSTRAAPKRPPASYQQITQGEAVLVHDYYAVLAYAPTYLMCDHALPSQKALGTLRRMGHLVDVRCIYRMTFFNDTSRYTAVWLDAIGNPLFSMTIRGLPVGDAA